MRAGREGTEQRARCQEDKEPAKDTQTVTQRAAAARRAEHSGDCAHLIIEGWVGDDGSVDINPRPRFLVDVGEHPARTLA